MDDGFLVNVNHSDKFSQDTAERFVKVFKEILVQFLDNDSLDDINYISGEDIEILDKYNQTECDLKYYDVLDAFNDNLVKYPENPLVSFKENVYTYAEGAFIVEKLAKHLINLGVNPQDCVSFVCERSEWYLFNVLSIISIGAIPVPIDVVLPDERIKFMLKDSNSKVVIVDNVNYEYISNLLTDIIILNLSDIMNQNEGYLSYLSVVYGELACILYTSGTTGVPKGVKITRKALINFSEFYIKKYDLSEDDVFALYASIGFDVAMEAIFTVICSGACLNIIPEDIKFDIMSMNDYFIENGVTYTHLPAQVTKIFIEKIKNTSLKVLCTGGEKLGEIITVSSDYRLVDSYGPTETFVDVTSIDVDEKIDSSSIGYLFDNIKAYILDNEFRRVPIGAIGELYLAGNQVSEGYLNRQEESNKAFIENPFDDGDFAVLYRTGDLVRLLPDGSLGIVGRRDGQVKIRGNRVELLEVESIIREINSVEEVTVQTIENNGELVAYVVMSGYVHEDNLRDIVCDYVGENKPDYMIPSFVIKLDEIPLNINGKVDKHALPEVDLNSLRAEYVAPTTKIEKEIVYAFEKVFNQKIGIHDDFVRLGGDSLTAIRLLSYIREEYNITVGGILSLHTPYAIANSVKEFSLDLDIYSLESGCPLNESQLNVYLDIVANDKNNVYLIPFFMEIQKKHELNDIIESLNTIFDVHPILGMCVSDEFEVPYLVKGSKPSICVSSDADKDFVAEFLSKPFDLHDSLCRFLIVENDKSYYLFAVFHHIIFDASSELVFRWDLSSILEGLSVRLDNLFLQVSAFDHQIKKTAEIDEAKSFYEYMLVDSGETNALLDVVDADGPGYYYIELDVNVSEVLSKYSINENVLFTSVFAYTLSRFTGSNKVLFNIIENGRNKFNNFDSVGMFVNTLPVLIDCKNQKISSFMKNVAGLIYGVMRYNYYPFRLLSKEYNIDSSILFQYMPDWIGGMEVEFNNDNSVRNFIEYDGELIADLSVEVIQNEGIHVLLVRYCDKYSSDFIKHFAESYKLILQEILDADKLSDINYISDEDILLMDNNNETEHSFDYNDVLDAFNDNLSRYSENKLVSYKNVSYNYGEGAFIAYKIARNLVDFGVNAQDYVGFLVPRSELYLLNILGIMSMGAIYVPLDDSLPDEQINIILKDSACKVVIVSDETYKRAKDLNHDCIILNISILLMGVLEVYLICRWFMVI